MLSSEVFASSKADGWVQATSSSSGLGGYYFSGDFASTLPGAESAPALNSQVLPFIRTDQNTTTEVVILNPGTTSGTVTINLFNSHGEQAGATVSQTVAAHAAIRLPTSAFAVNPS